MSEPARIGLRLLCFLLFLFGVAIVVAMITPGPTEVAEWMGENCDPSGTDLDTTGPDQQCTVFDVLTWLWWAPILILLGGVMALALGPQDKGTRTLDLSRIRRR